MKEETKLEQSPFLYEFSYSDTYLKHIKQLKKENKANLLKKIDSLLDEIEQEPKKGTGNPEALKHYGEAEVWSRRIDKKHRLVYEIFEEEKRIDILSAYGHYKDKK